MMTVYLPPTLTKEAEDILVEICNRLGWNLDYDAEVERLIANLPIEDENIFHFLCDTVV